MLRTDFVLTLTRYFQFQSPESHCSDPHTCKRSRPKVHQLERVETDGQTDGGNCITSHPNMVGNKLLLTLLLVQFRLNFLFKSGMLMVRVAMLGYYR